MPFRRDIVLDANPATTYDALREMVAPNLDDGAFEITVDEPDVEFGIAYMHLISSSHYRFNIESVEEGTRLEAELWLGGLIGPLHSMLRFWSHNRHLEKLLDGVERKATAILSDDEAFDEIDRAADWDPNIHPHPDGDADSNAAGPDAVGPDADDDAAPDPSATDAGG